MKMNVQLEPRDVARIINSLITIPEFVPEAEVEPLIGGTARDLWRIAEELKRQTRELDRS